MVPVFGARHSKAATKTDIVDHRIVKPLCASKNADTGGSEQARQAIIVVKAM
jgi:hypothetical protein